MRLVARAACLVALSTAAAAARAQQLPAPPPRTSCDAEPQSRRFDFWVGEWNVTTADGTHVRDSSVQRIPGSCAVFERWRSAKGFAGESLNAYNAPLGMWQQFRVGQTGAVTDFRESRWVGTSLQFMAHAGSRGAERLQRLTITPVDANTVRQHGEVSTDGGATWTTTYDYFYHRKG